MFERSRIFWMAMVCAFLLARPSPALEKPETFVKILEEAYRVSCDDPAKLRDYYFANAEIIHDGRQTTLEETIRDLKESTESAEGLICTYSPKVRASRIQEEMAYLVVRETIRLSTHGGEDRYYQICTYVFMKEGSRWKIANDHCSSIQTDTASYKGLASRAK